MAFDTTVAGAAANAYISVAEADAFANDDIGAFPEHWLTGGMSADQKENTIVQATLDIDAYIGETIPWASSQRLRFPRSSDYTGTAPGTPFIQRFVKEATYKQAIYLASNIEQLEAAATRRARGLYSFNDDDVSGTLALDPRLGQLAPDAIALLRAVSGATGAATVQSVPMRTLTYLDSQGLLS